MARDLRPLSRDEVRSLDVRAADELLLPTLLLMENAGRGAAAFLVELIGEATPPPRVLMLCGPGNNGGDGGVVARHLDAWGIPVHLVWFAKRKRLRGDARAQSDILERSEIPQTAWLDDHSAEVDPGELDALLADADWLVDGLLGTGLDRAVGGVLRSRRGHQPLGQADVGPRPSLGPRRRHRRTVGRRRPRDRHRDIRRAQKRFRRPRRRRLHWPGRRRRHRPAGEALAGLLDLTC